MTQDKNQGSEDLSWMEIADADATNEARHSGQRLPLIAAAISLVIIAGGAVFAQTSNEAPAEAELTSVTQTSQTPSAMSVPPATTSSISPSAIPVIPNVAPSAGKYGDDDKYEDRDDDEEEDDD
jgi:hypothetical protein